MALKYGFVGFPNVGKSTLFNAVAGADVASANFPFCTIEPHVGVANLPDERLEKLAKLVGSASCIHATLVFNDIPGLIKGASDGEGLGNQFLEAIRKVDAIVHVLRCFDDPAIQHVAGGVDPVFDRFLVEEELLLKDIESVKKRIQKLKSKGKGVSQDFFLALLAHLEARQPARKFPIKHPEEQLYLSEMHLLTAKPIIYLANIDEESVATGSNRHVEALRQAVAQDGHPVITVCAPLEVQFSKLPAEEQRDFLAIYGLQKNSLELLIRTSFNLLGLINYFTAGPKETRAWTIKRGTQAPQAAAVIHTDLERTFVKAEVIKWQDYMAYKGEQGARHAGKLRLEGKAYEVQDGDVIYFKCAS